MWKSTLRWLRATRDPQETQPRVPQLFERLEPRLLLSVVWETLQPTAPATPENYALYISENTQRVDPTPEQTRIFIEHDGTQTKAKVTLVFPDSGYSVTNWGQVQRQDNTFFVNAEVTHWTDSPATIVTTLTHEYDLGTLANGDYVFEFRAWDQPVESREFRPGWEQFVEYVPTPEQTKLFITQDGTSTKANVSMLFGSPAYVVRDWGEVQQDGNTLYVDAELEQWTGVALCVMTTETHAYDLGTLAEGDYVFEFRASGQLVESREFRPGPDQYVEYMPTPEQATLSFVSDGTQIKAKVTMTFPTDGYMVRWGEAQRLAGTNSFYVNAEVERWTGALTPGSTTVTHEYDLGTLADGNYYFCLYAWGQSLESRGFWPGSGQIAPYTPVPDQTTLLVTYDGAKTKAKVTLVFPSAGYNVTNWGTVRQEGNTFFVDAEVERWTDPAPAVVTTVVYEYKLGTPAAGDYVFEFRAWGQTIASREFSRGLEGYAEYVPTPEQTTLFITQDGTNTKALISLKFPSSGYVAHDWGQVQQDGNTLYVNAKLESPTGFVVGATTTEAHEYDLGALAEGDYVFEFRASGQLVESRKFRPGPDQYVQYNPTPEQTSVFIVPDGGQMKAKVTMVFPTDGYVVRWGEVQRQGDTHFYVHAEVERWTGAVNPVSTTVTHDYDLGTLADGNYYFYFYAWDQHIETREFQPGREQWVQYVPTTEPTNILVMADGAGGTKARVIITFNDMGYGVHDWGTVQRTGSTFSVNAEVEKWTGGAATSLTTVSHDYNLGNLPDGNYVFQFNAWQQPVESKEFAIPTTLRPVYRFWSPVLLQHFYTLSTAERDKLINNYSSAWTYEQVAYYAFPTNTEPGTVPVYRFWSGTLNTHFYTARQAERDKLINSYSQVWAYEGVAFYAYPNSPGYELPIGTHCVYRLWSGTLGSHFFTASDAEMNKVYGLTTRGWEWEGVAWYAYAPVILDRQSA